MNKRKILVVDDERGFTSMLKLNLEATGSYDVRIENDPQQALPAALQYRPDLVLLDIIMPSLEGPDVAFLLKNNETVRDTPIIFLTATVTKDEVDSQGGKIGGHAFVAKPSSLSVLLGSIEKNLPATSKAD